MIHLSILPLHFQVHQLHVSACCRCQARQAWNVGGCGSHLGAIAAVAGAVWVTAYIGRGRPIPCNDQWCRKGKTTDWCLRCWVGVFHRRTGFSEITIQSFAGPTEVPDRGSLPFKVYVYTYLNLQCNVT